MFDHLRARFDKAGRPTRLMVLCRSPASWMRVFAPDAPIWQGIEGVSETRLLRTTFDLWREGHSGGRQSLIMPLRERAIIRAPRGYWGLYPTPRAVRLFADKLAFARYGIHHGLEAHMPRQIDPDAVSRFPVVVKEPNSAGGQGVRIVNDRLDLARTLELAPFKGRRVVLQAFVEGPESVLHGVAVEGRVIWHRLYDYVTPPDLAVRTQFIELPFVRREAPAEMLALVERFLAPVGYNGPFNADFKLTADGSMLLEINPRFGGSIFREESLADLQAAITQIVARSRLVT